MEMRSSLHKYFKAAFQIFLLHIGVIGNDEYEMFRSNGISDFAKLWLQLLKPWFNRTDFLEAALNLNFKYDERNPLA